MSHILINSISRGVILHLHFFLRLLRQLGTQGLVQNCNIASNGHPFRGLLTMKLLGLLPRLTYISAFHQIERLRHQLAQVQRNEAFLLHAGDCAESFDACTHVRLHHIDFLPPIHSCIHVQQENITHKIGLILSFSLILIWGARLPVVR